MTRPFFVVITDHPWASIEAEKHALGRVGAEMRIAESGDENELVALVEDADAILTCFAPVTPAVVRAGARLQVVGRYGIGVDNIAVGEATRRGIVVTNVPMYCQDEVTDHALALMLAFARGLRTFDHGVRGGDWSLGQLGQPLRRIRGQTLGILGLGRIGTRLAEKAQALGLRVITHDPRAEPAHANRYGVELVTLLELAARSDYVSLHLPLTEATTRLIGAEFLKEMKETAFLINTARGGVVDQDALVTALQEGWIGGAGLDVFTPERIDVDNALLALPNVIVTPHVAYYSEESLLELGRLAAENVAAVLGGYKPAAVVNPEVLSLERWQGLREPEQR
jgi:D-3-phosphoglycerate dehydrogenase